MTFHAVHYWIVSRLPHCWSSSDALECAAPLHCAAPFLTMLTALASPCTAPAEAASAKYLRDRPPSVLLSPEFVAAFKVRRHCCLSLGWQANTGLACFAFAGLEPAPALASEEHGGLVSA